MPRAVVGRWGKNLAIRFPAEIAEAVALREGDRVEIVSDGDEVVIRHLEIALNADAIFADKSPEEWRALYRGVYDWGPDTGRERVEE